MIKISMIDILQNRFLENTYGTIEVKGGNLLLTFTFNNNKISVAKYNEIKKKLRAEEV